MGTTFQCDQYSKLKQKYLKHMATEAQIYEYNNSSVNASGFLVPKLILERIHDFNFSPKLVTSMFAAYLKSPSFSCHIARNTAIELQDTADPRHFSFKV